MRDCDGHNGQVDRHRPHELRKERLGDIPLDFLGRHNLHQTLTTGPVNPFIMQPMMFEEVRINVVEHKFSRPYQR